MGRGVNSGRERAEIKRRARGLLTVIIFLSILIDNSYTRLMRAEGAIKMLDLTSTSEQPNLHRSTRDYRLEKIPARRRKREPGPAALQLAGVNGLLQMIASGRELPEILGALCRFVE